MISELELMQCGKYANRTFKWVMNNDLNYCRWVLENCESGPLKKFGDWLENNGTSLSKLLMGVIDRPRL